MLDVLTANGYLYLFALSFLAATVVPLGSEWLLVALLMQNLDPAWLLASAKRAMCWGRSPPGQLASGEGHF